MIDECECDSLAQPDTKCKVEENHMSSNEIKLAADSRTEFGKGASRRLRREGKVPAVIYGHGTDPVHIALPGHESLLALRAANALLSITIDGGKAQLALPKQVQRDPLKGFLEHVDLLRCVRCRLAAGDDEGNADRDRFDGRRRPRHHEAVGRHRTGDVRRPSAVLLRR